MANSLPPAIETELEALTQAARVMRKLESAKKNAALNELAAMIQSEEARILQANALDLKALSADTPEAFRDRLLITPERLKGMVLSLRQVAALPDPVGESVEEKTLANGLKLKRVRAPLGVLFMIFESRPNVILEAFSLAFKSGNVILLRGGSESKKTAECFYSIMRGVFSNFAHQPFYGMDDYDRDLVLKLLKRKDKIDIVVPRGGDRLIEFVQRESAMPIIKNDRGLCHAYVDDEADLEMAVRVVSNGKVQRPGVCNSLETVLVHEKVAAEFLPKLYAATNDVKLEWRGDEKTVEILSSKDRITSATTEDYDTEYLALILNSRVVTGLEQALSHIQKHGSKHSETILTRNAAKAALFQEEVDAAAVYWNASTRFTDGFEFGLGGELGISTQKLHVRGPVGLRELTTPRWLIVGTGQTRL